MKIYSYNTENASKNLFFWQEGYWKDRTKNLPYYLNDFDILCLQEATVLQNKVIAKQFKDLKCINTYTYYPLLLSDSNPIYYNPKTVECITSGAFALTTTPDRKYHKDKWQRYYRNCVWAKFRDIKENRIFYVFNTHLSNKDPEQYSYLVLYICNILNGYNYTDELILCGDFNSTLTSDSFEDILFRFKSARQLLNIPEIPTYENNNNNTKYAIDHFFIRNITPLGYTSNNTPEYLELSDHYPIKLEF